MVFFFNAHVTESSSFIYIKSPVNVLHNIYYKLILHQCDNFFACCLSLYICLTFVFINTSVQEDGCVRVCWGSELLGVGGRRGEAHVFVIIKSQCREYNLT